MGIDENIYADNVFLIIQAICKQSDQYPSWAHIHCQSPQLILNPWLAEFILGIMKIYLHFLSSVITTLLYVIIILLHGRQQPLLSCKVNKIAADDLATEGARSSAAMILILISQNILVSALQWLMKYPLVTFFLVALKLPIMHQVTSLSATSVHNKHTVYTGYWQYGHIACIHPVGKKKLLSAVT